MSGTPSSLALAELCSVLGLVLMAIAMATGDGVAAAGALVLHATAMGLAVWGGDA